MTASDVVDLLQFLEQNHISVCVDGGWGVDALLGRHTRRHSDLDIAIRHQDVPALRALLGAKGYRDVPRADTRDCNFVLGDDQGHEVDVHSYTFDAEGRNIYFGEIRTRVAGRIQEVQPLTEPAARPSTIQRWMNM